MIYTIYKKYFFFTKRTNKIISTNIIDEKTTIIINISVIILVLKIESIFYFCMSKFERNNLYIGHLLNFKKKTVRHLPDSFYFKSSL